MRLRSAALIYLLLYLVGAGLWAMFKISAGCPCGWIADCIKCGTVDGILESITAWGFVAAILAIPIVVILLIVQYFIRSRRNNN